MSTGIGELLRTRVLAQVVQQVTPVASKWKVLVVDAFARKVLNSCVKTSEILEQNVTIVEMLELRRTPFPDTDAVYLLMPTPESVDLLIQDYTRGKPPYAAVHLFFISALSDTLFDKIKKSPVQRHVQTLKELNMDFLALEPQVFSLDLPNALPAVINAQTPSHLNYELAPVAKRLVSVLATLGEYPYIRYYSPPTPTITPASSNGPLVEKFSRLVQDELDELARIDKSFPPQTTFSRAILLIVDRGLDVVAPLVHEFTYQALVNDYLVLEDGNKIVNRSDDDKVAVLDETDKIWVSQKYKHIAEVLEFVSDGIKKFSSENKAAAFVAGGSRNNDKIAELKDTLGALPEFLEMKAKYSLHSNMCEDCMAILGKYNHMALSNVEQNLATGEDSDFKPVKNIAASVRSMLSDRSLSHEDKLRLLMIYIVAAEGIPDSERQQLFDLVRLTREEFQAVTNLSMLGVRLSESISGRTDKANPYAAANLKGNRGRVKEVKFENSRYIPIIKHVIEDQVRNAMDSSVFTWVREPPTLSGKPATGRKGSDADDSVGISSQQRTKPSWATSRTAGGSLNRTNTANSGSSTLGRAPVDLRTNGPRVIVFVLGGLTYSEIRAANEVMLETQRDVIIGSTHVLNPHSFLDTLKTLHKRSAGTQPAPHPYDPTPPSAPPVPVPESHGRSRDRSRHENDGGRRQRGGDDDNGRYPQTRSDDRLDRTYSSRDRYVDGRGQSRGTSSRDGGGESGRYRDDGRPGGGYSNNGSDMRGGSSKGYSRDVRDDRVGRSAGSSDYHREDRQE
ncbi:vacuolar sorting protein VPS33/slp1, partial [Entophlyctis sp. JEL0112]